MQRKRVKNCTHQRGDFILERELEIRNPEKGVESFMLPGEKGVSAPWNPEKGVESAIAHLSSPLENPEKGVESFEEADVFAPQIVTKESRKGS